MKVVVSISRILSQSSRTRAVHLICRPHRHPFLGRSAFAKTRYPISELRNIRTFNTMSASATEQPQATPPAAAPSTEDATPAKPELPPLTPAEFKVYNQMAEKMNYFHNHFRHQWTLLHTAASTGRRPQNMSLKQFLDTGLQFTRHLTAHHGIEEAHVFPMLARRMPEFRTGGRGGGAELLRQHKQIHDGMDKFEAYLRACRDRETELELGVLKEKMDSWGEVLWTHLDQEVETLGAENMRKYWTMEEVRRMPM
ncbi:hypothetical protein HER10_EVM0001494 [Colletotrichum scovillei]|uniref:Neutrophil cytosol factor 2 protein n=1 Tax=Colletotrichum scovillei TaxID=1209932 RepID=A0A9P7UGR4_9PEZI|nr:uncharacterized protein HER10_EVM0001494 [Colletotrichum scovillei]KAF4782651.1 hypothetical protein HER10_EVM0001494 [Colletotrichum scovillei]KAG7052007.1 neutrophil cytosol factor 2 protein [Colletotrichum scovillei]KAG7071042.1 neutrophil cytosol factor 2 protein [Colletotrichum scovillei]KAG7079286.1 neutrophil cytosol factor 2 protein [Colletotrichum scovillei]